MIVFWDPLFPRKLYYSSLAYVLVSFSKANVVFGHPSLAA